MGAVWWYLQRITGAALVVLLVMHFWVEHFVSESLRRGDLTYDAIRARITNPAWQAIDIAFLLIALVHGLSGARNIVLDYSRVGRRGARIATAALGIVGIVWAWWGVAAFRNLR
jgi:succinate dehydrogenase / fumarate reductase, membrane anchor subunit